MKNVLKTLDHMMSLSIDLKRLTQDLIDVLKDVIIFKKHARFIFIICFA